MISSSFLWAKYLFPRAGFLCSLCKERIRAFTSITLACKHVRQCQRRTMNTSPKRSIQYLYNPTLLVCSEPQKLHNKQVEVGGENWSLCRSVVLNLTASNSASFKNWYTEFCPSLLPIPETGAALVCLKNLLECLALRKTWSGGWLLQTGIKSVSNKMAA